MEHLPDSFIQATDAAALASHLVRTYAPFAHLADANIAYLLSQHVPMLHGAPCAALIAVPRTQGPLHHLYDALLAGFCSADARDPQFVVLIYAPEWTSLSPQGRERLIFHELRHVQAVEDPDTGEPKIGEDGQVKLKLVPHDAEFFLDEVERYGPALCGLDNAALAIAAGYRQEQRRGLRIA